MQVIRRRLRTAFLHKVPSPGTVWRFVRRPRVWITLLLWLVVTPPSLYAGAEVLAAFPKTVSVLGQQATAGTQFVGLNPCNSSRLVYQRIVLEFPHTHNCGIEHLQLTLPAPLDPNNLIANDQPTPATRPHAGGHGANNPRHKSAASPAPKVTPRPPLPPGERALRTINEANSQLGQAISGITDGVHNGLMFLVGAVDLAFAAFVSWLAIMAISGIRRLFTSRSYSRWSKFAFVCATSVVSLTVSGYAWAGTAFWASGTTINQVVSHIASLVPPPEGPVDTTHQAAVDGDSTVSFLGGIDAHPSCWQARNALANKLTGHTPGNLIWTNHACSQATIERGELGPQVHGPNHDGTRDPPQISRDKQMPDLRIMALAIGSDDLGLPEEVRLCVVEVHCEQNGFLQADYQQRRDRFKTEFKLLLNELQNLPTHPYVVVIPPYRVMEPNAAAPGKNCPDTRGLTSQEISYLDGHQQWLYTFEVQAVTSLNDPRFTIAHPLLKELCTGPSPAPDINSIWLPNGQINPVALHPTDSGENAIAIAVAVAMSQFNLQSPQPSPSPSSTSPSPTPSGTVSTPAAASGGATRNYSQT